VFCAFSSQFGLDKETALKVAAAFGGGMARMGETCGAVTGAFMVIGMKYGMTDPAKQEAKEKSYEVVREFVRIFKLSYGATACRDLLGCDISTPSGLADARERRIFETVCPKFVGTAVEILDNII
jgi:C_GCAxxG_C_C family probable redox protein